MTKDQSDMILRQLFYFMLTQIIPSKFQEYKEIAAIIHLFKLAIEGVKVTKARWIKVADAIPREYKYSAYASASNQKTMLKIGNKLIELFREV